MFNKSLAGCVALSLLAGPAWAQSAATRQNDTDPSRSGAVTSGQGDRASGGLSANEIDGKRLLDADGNVIGYISKVSGDGRSALVRPKQGGSTISVAISDLSLGMGAHTVIDARGGSSGKLNAQSAAQTRSVEEESRTVVTPPPEVTTTTTSQSIITTPQ